jgi:hypothetical protein
MDDVELIYLESDDEVTSVVRRLRDATAPRVVVVAPGRSRATSSAVAMRLLARFGAEAGRDIAIVGDALTRSLAAEAGLAAYLSVDDARVAAPVDGAVLGEPRRAGIQVVRGPAAEETAPTMPAAPIPADDAAWAETRPLAVSTPSPAPRLAATRRGRRVPIGLLLGLVALLVAAAAVAGAVLLPAAEVTLRLETVAIAPQTYSIDVPTERRAAGTLEEVGTVTATGTYPILTQATGTVTLFNFSGAPVDVDANTLVATGEEPGAQAFSTVTPVVVPAGQLTPEGRIQAGEQTVNVMAVAAGLGGNVAAEAIDTVLSEGPRNRLRGFANNATRLVLNTAPTTGGTESTGPVILQEDVDAAVAAVRVALAEALVQELGDADLVAVPVGTPAEPEISGDDGLAGTQDQPTAEIRGMLAYDQWLVDPDELERVAGDRLAADDEAVPANHRLVDAATTVRVLQTTASADAVTASVEVGGRAEAIVDEEAVIERVRGRPIEEAERALESLGRVEVEPWPGWVTEVPDLEWRIDVQIESTDEPAASPSAAASPS